MTTSMKQLKCAVCGAFAGRFHQHANQDTGWGICRPCVDRLHLRGYDPEEMRFLYGIEGHNYAGPNTYTPGPWHYVYGGVWTTPEGPDDGGVCVAQRANANIEPTIKDRNMRLCAAAPDLLDALEAAIALMVEHGINPSVRAYAAVMKARGPRLPNNTKETNA